MAKLKFLSLDGLLEMMANKESFKLVDVLPEEYYKDWHIPAAINIPAEKLGGLAKDHLKKTDTIIVYCANYACHASTNAASTLLRLGYKKVLDFKGGKKAWELAGLDLEK